MPRLAPKGSVPFSTVMKLVSPPLLSGATSRSACEREGQKQGAMCHPARAASFWAVGSGARAWGHTFQIIMTLLAHRSVAPGGWAPGTF